MKSRSSAGSRDNAARWYGDSPSTTQHEQESSLQEDFIAYEVGLGKTWMAKDFDLVTNGQAKEELIEMNEDRATMMPRP